MLDSTNNAQRERVLNHLQDGPLSTHHARTVLDVPHPAGRVKELRGIGHKITTKLQTIETAQGCHKMAVYRLVRGG